MSGQVRARGLWLVCALAVAAGGCLGEYEADYAEMPSDGFHGAAAEKPPALLDSEVARKVGARVRVRRQAEPTPDSAFLPAPQVKVTLEWLELPRGAEAHGQAPKPKVIETYPASTDASGWAVAAAVRVPKDSSRYVMRAVVEEHGMKHFSKPLRWDRDGSLAGELDLMMVTGDLNHVIGGTLITTASIPQRMEEHPAAYGYVQFQQVLELRVDQHVIYNTGSAVLPEHGRGVAFEVPLKASSVSAQVLAMSGGQMRDGADFGQVEVTDSTIYYKGLIYPEGESTPQIRLMVQFFLEADGSGLVFEQPIRQYWDDARFAFTQETDLPEHPVLSISLDAPQFTEQSDQAQAGVMEGKKVKVARKPAQPLMPGDTLRVVVGGLPYPEPQLPWYALGASGLLLVVGGWLGAREVAAARRRRGSVTALLADLNAEVEALYLGLAALRQDLAAGAISPKAAAHEEERLKVRLVALLQRREALTAPPPPSGEAPAGDPAGPTAGADPHPQPTA